MEDFKLNEEEHWKFLERIKKETFLDVLPVKNPVIYIVSGQPGCGKSGLISLVQEEMKDNIATINGDEFRRYHPEGKKIYKLYKEDYAALTDPDVRKWTKQVFDHAIKQRYNIVFEGTMRTDQIVHTIDQLKEVGYKVNLKVLAVNELESRTAIYQRYEDQLDHSNIARFTHRRSHDDAYKGLPITLAKIIDKGNFDELKLYRRNDNREIVPFAEFLSYNANNAVDLIWQERNRPWSEEKHINFKDWTNELIKRISRKDMLSDKIQDIKILQDEGQFKELIDKAPMIEELPKKPNSQELYAAYAKDILKNLGWTNELDQQIIAKMLKNGVEKYQVRSALKYSLNKITSLTKMVEQVAKLPEIKQVLKDRDRGR